MSEQWYIFKGTRQAHDGITQLPEPPAWRRFGIGAGGPEPQTELSDGAGRGATFHASPDEIQLINTALLLRRPLLITGRPGCGKSSLPYAVAHELRLGPVLAWPITSRSTLKEGLYSYDAISHLQAASAAEQADPRLIGSYLRLGPLGQALLPSRYPRVLLIDEIDKSDIDLPNDLLNIFEEGTFDIPELQRIKKEAPVVKVQSYHGEDEVEITNGHVRCYAFPFVVLTSNDEREFPPAFLRRCIRLNVEPPRGERLKSIVQAHLGADGLEQAEQLIANFDSTVEAENISTDQLLSAIYLRLRGAVPDDPAAPLYRRVTQPLDR